MNNFEEESDINVVEYEIIDLDIHFARDKPFVVWLYGQCFLSPRQRCWMFLLTCVSILLLGIPALGGLLAKSPQPQTHGSSEHVAMILAPFSTGVVVILYQEQGKNYITLPIERSPHWLLQDKGLVRSVRSIDNVMYVDTQDGMVDIARVGKNALRWHVQTHTPRSQSVPEKNEQGFPFPPDMVLRESTRKRHLQRSSQRLSHF